MLGGDALQEGHRQAEQLLKPVNPFAEALDSFIEVHDLLFEVGGLVVNVHRAGGGLRRGFCGRRPAGAAGLRFVARAGLRLGLG